MAQIDERFFNVDRNGSLRVPGVLWVALAFLLRHLILVFIVFASVKRSPEIVRLLGQGFSWLVLPLEMPALVLVFAAANRSPAAGKFVRVVWRHARAIVLATVLMHLAWCAWVLVQSDVWRTWPELFLASCCLLDVVIATSVLRDDYYRQLFNDFPAPTADPATRPRS